MVEKGLREQDVEDKRSELENFGLHFCKRFKNLVKFNPEFCGKCPFNGLSRPQTSAAHSETCF